MGAGRWRRVLRQSARVSDKERGWNERDFERVVGACVRRKVGGMNVYGLQREPKSTKTSVVAMNEARVGTEEVSEAYQSGVERVWLL